MPAPKPPLIIHIGRNKTGTTALQRFLGANRPALMTAGYCYPAAGTGASDLTEAQQAEILSAMRAGEPLGAPALELIRKRNGHFKVAQALTIASVREHGLEASLNSAALVAVRKELLETLALRQGATGLLSSETFQNAAPETLLAAFAEFDINIHCYLREQAGYLLSEYAQRVQASAETRSLEEYLSDWKGGDLLAFAERWASAFSEERVHFHAYDVIRSQPGGVLHHFLQEALSLDPGSPEWISELDDDANPTLDAELIAFKLRFNREQPDRAAQQDVYHALRLMALERKNQPRLALSAEKFDAIKARFDEQNRELSRRYMSEKAHLQLLNQSTDNIAPPLTEARYSDLLREMETLLQNTNAIRAYNDFIETTGNFGEEYRSF